jgi:two-component system, OmpR family, response regulator
LKNQISVLIVDDETIILDCLSIFFEDEGFSVKTASNAQEALQLIASTKPQACVTDLGLDDMSGEEFILKAHNITHDTHFLIHTGSSFTLTDNLRSIGMTEEDIIIKPALDFTIITNRIKVCVSEREDKNVQ